jgi:cytochrome c nitrite reductase small subunit
MNTISRNFLIVLGITIGLFIGIGVYTFLYAKGYSYFTNDPNACANCHVMNQQYNGWIKSSHHAVAVCNDCHTPDGIIGKYYTKASNGFWHSFYFTTGWFPDNIEITQRNVHVTENACSKCHQDIIEMMNSSHKPKETISCISCHSSVGHLE